MEKRRVTVELIGGPCDGEILDISGAPDTLEHGTALPSAGCAYPGGRSFYDPKPGDTQYLYWTCDVP